MVFILLICAYLLGSIPSGVWVGKLFFKKDIREFGSGNMGTTNTFRVLGKRAGTVVFIMDLLKGTLAVLLPTIFHIDSINPLIFGLCAVVGHVYPIFTKFHGGKAVATSAGLLLGYNPLFFVLAIAIFFVILFISSMVSLSSILALVIVTILTVILPYVAPVIMPEHNWLLTALALGVTCFITYRHKDNIKRIKDGTENKVPFGLNKRKTE